MSSRGLTAADGWSSSECQRRRPFCVPGETSVLCAEPEHYESRTHYAPRTEGVIVTPTVPFESYAGEIVSTELRRSGLVEGGCSDACMAQISATVEGRDPARIVVRHGEAEERFTLTAGIWTDYGLRKALLSDWFAGWARELHGAPRPIFADTGRPVVQVFKHGRVAIVDDLTVGEARHVIRALLGAKP